MPDGRKGRGRSPPPATPYEAAKATKGQAVKVGNAVLGHLYDANKGYRPHSFQVVRGRVSEIEKLIHHRHGEYVDTDDQIVYAEIAAIHIREPNNIIMWIKAFCPGLNTAQMRKIIRDAVAPQRLPRADQVAKALGVTYAERQALDLRTIGATDVDRKQRAALAAEARRQRDRLRDAERRRQKGAKPRAKYLAESVTAACKRLGISRKTYYKRKEREMKKTQPAGQVTSPSPHINASTKYMGGATCYPPDGQSLRGVRGVTLMAIQAAQRPEARRSGLAALTASVREAARSAPPTLREIEASLKNRGHRDWHAEIVQRARALVEAGIDLTADRDDPNIDFGDDAPSAA